MRCLLLGKVVSIRQISALQGLGRKKLSENLTEKWLWKNKWCVDNGLSPWHNVNWEAAEKAYNEQFKEK